MRIRAYILSVLLHAGVLVLTVTGLSLWPSEPPVPEQSFTVEFGAMAELERAAEVQAPLPEKEVPLPKAKPSQVLASAPSAPVVDRITGSPETRQADTAPAPDVPQPTVDAERVPEPPRPTAAEAARAAARPATETATASADPPPRPAAARAAVETPRISAAPDPAAADAEAAETAETAPPGGAPAEEAAPRAADVPEAALASASRAAPARSSQAERAEAERVAVLQPLPEPEERQARAEEPAATPPPPKPEPAAAESAAAPDAARRPEAAEEPARPVQQTAAAVPKQAPEPKSAAPAKPDAVLSAAVPRPKPRPQRLEVASAPEKPRPEPPKTEDKADSKEFDPSRLAALLDKRLDTSKADVQRDRENAAPRQSDTVVTQRRDAQLASAPLSASELAAIRGQFERCWNPPAGARDAHNLVVKVRIWLRQDGTLLREPVVVNRGDAGDRFWRVAAESAVRAVRKCEPVQGLDPEKYERWRDIELTFNPRDMLG